MTVLLLDGHGNQALACLRSYSKAGYRVILGSDRSSWTVGWSRYCREKFLYPPPAEDAGSFVRCICGKLTEVGGALVVAMTERTILRLSAHRQQVIAAGGVLILPPHETILRAFDKARMLELAQSLNIGTPQSVLVDRTADVARIIGTLKYPVVLKARASEELRPDGRTVSASAQRYAQNDEQLCAALRFLHVHSSAVLVQEFIQGRGVGYFALMRHGELRVEFAHERIRDVRPCGSGSSLRKSIELDARVRSAGLAILSSLQWHGVAMVEFRVREDGTPVFMEVNGRFWNSLALAIHAGVDFPALLAQLASGGDVPRNRQHRVGVHCRWLLGDFRHLLEVWRGRPPGYPGKYPPRLRTSLAFIIPQWGMHHDNFQWDDPLPELGDWLHFFVRKLPDGINRLRSSLQGSHAQRRSAHS